MFNSNIKVSDLINSIKNEADIALSIPDDSFISWLNSLEQTLYSEIIKEQAECEFDGDLSSIDKEGCDKVRFEDIHAVYADGVQLKATTLTSGFIFPKTYYKKENNIAFSKDVGDKAIRITYFVRPELKNADNISGTTVMLPPEFIDLAKAKLRGEAYKLANEDGLAAKWLNDYNVLLETFKVWIQSKAPAFGI